MSDVPHIVSTDSFTDRNCTARLFRAATTFRNHGMQKILPQRLKGRILATVFYEPSTRTRFSFEAAMLKLGGQVITTESAGHFSSAIKGETLEDTIRIVAGYADAIVLRHPEIGAAARAAAVSSVPVINAGDGAGEHPTQALLDLYTIRQELGRLDDFTIAMAGDLRYGRTVHSLIRLLGSRRGVRVVLASPAGLRLPKEYRLFLQERKIPFRETEAFETALQSADVLYMTRVQKERVPARERGHARKSAFVLHSAHMSLLPRHAVIMHPLPRAGEIDPAVDADPRAAYFRQAENGLYIRMALLLEVMGCALQGNVRKQ